MIEQYADALQVNAHLLGNHGLSEAEFYESGILRGAIEVVRGRFAATKRDKQDFVRRVLNLLEDAGRIRQWETVEGEDRHDYRVVLPDGSNALIVTKGCLDGNNTSIYERPRDIDELIIWSLCSNPGADLRRNVWSGLRTRLSPSRQREHGMVDGLIVWDPLCNSPSRPCPKLISLGEAAVVIVGQYAVPPPCLYTFPVLGAARDGTSWAASRSVEEVRLLQAFANHFAAGVDSTNFVEFQESRNSHGTRVIRAGLTVREEVGRSSRPGSVS
jgi:hypothetical protein